MLVRLGFTGDLEWIRTSDLCLDTRYQRAINPEHLAGLVREFDDIAIDVIKVSRRANQHCYIIDGQHRVLAIREKQLDHLPVRCAVHEKLTWAQERRLFLKFNKVHLPLGAYAAFKAQLDDPDLTTETIVATLNRLGLQLIPPGVNLGPGQIGCLSYLLELDERALPILTVITQGWGHTPGAYKRIYLEMVERLLRNISPEDVIYMLRKITPSDLDRAVIRRQDSPGVQLGTYLAVCRDMLRADLPEAPL